MDKYHSQCITCLASASNHEFDPTASSLFWVNKTIFLAWLPTAGTFTVKGEFNLLCLNTVPCRRPWAFKARRLLPGQKWERRLNAFRAEALLPSLKDTYFVIGFNYPSAGGSVRWRCQWKCWGIEETFDVVLSNKVCQRWQRASRAQWILVNRVTAPEKLAQFSD